MMKQLTRIDPRWPLLALAFVLALAALWTIGHAMMLDRRVERALTLGVPAMAADEGAPDQTEPPATATADGDRPTSPSLATDAASSPTLATDAETSPTLAADAATSPPMQASMVSIPAGAVTSDGVRPGQPPPGARPGGPPGGRPGGPPGGDPGAGPAAELPEKLAGLIDQKPVFGKKSTPQPQLQGILGNQAMISGNWIEVGQSRGQTKLLEIHPTKVVIEFEGNRRDLTLWSDLPGTR